MKQEFEEKEKAWKQEVEKMKEVSQEMKYDIWVKDARAETLEKGKDIL